MVQICATISIPDFNSLYNSALPSMTFPPGNITIPALPVIPDPIFPGIGCTNLEINMIIQQLQQYQLLITFKAFLQPLVDFIGISLDSILPKIPETDLTLIDLLALDANKIYAALAALPLSVLQTLPGVPNPISYAFNAPSFSITIAIQGVIAGYMNTLISVVTSLINRALSILGGHIPGLPTIPDVPSLSDLQALIIPPSLTIPEVTTLLNQFSLNALLALIPIPGFPAFPALPIPLVVSFNSPELNMMMGLSLLYTNLVMYPMTLIFNYIEQTLGHFIGFAFPKVCITF